MDREVNSIYTSKTFPSVWLAICAISLIIPPCVGVLAGYGTEKIEADETGAQDAVNGLEASLSGTELPKGYLRIVHKETLVALDMTAKSDVGCCLRDFHVEMKMIPEGEQ